MYPKLSIHIVAWNSMRFIPDLIASLSQQTFQDYNILLIDNGSTDGVETFIRQQYPQITFLRNARNLGFSGAHNQGIRYALEHWDPAEYDNSFVLVTNPDILMTPTFLEELMKATVDHPTVGAFGGKLRRAFGENLADETLQETVRSDLLDSTGLQPHRNRTFTDRGAGEMDTGQYDNAREVFGLSGALVLYRASAINEVRNEYEFFDDDFFAYKEDVDLAWRLQRSGWDALYVPEALAFHYRGMFGAEKMGLWQRFINRRSKSKSRSFYSTRNQLLLLIKNLSFIDAMLAAFLIASLEVARFFFTLLFESSNLRAYASAFCLTPTMLKKRFRLMRSRKRSSKELRKWFV